MTRGKGVSFDRSGFGSVGYFRSVSDFSLDPMPERKTCLWCARMLVANQ